MDSETTEKPLENKKVTWLKRLGMWSFLFFLIKGLLWLIVPAVIYWVSK